MRRVLSSALLIFLGMFLGAVGFAIPAARAAAGLTFYFQEFDYSATRASCALKAGIALNTLKLGSIDTFNSGDSSVVYGFASDNTIGAIICTGKDSDTKGTAMQFMIGPDVPGLKTLYDQLDKAFT